MATKRISELTPTSTLDDGCCFPVVSGGATKRVFFSVIKNYIDGKTAGFQSKSIEDSGGYFSADTVEGALQEIGAELSGINTLLGSGVITL